MYQRLPTAPSIPSTKQSLGYDEGADGKLHAQALPEQDTTMGPAYYTPMHVRHAVMATSQGATTTTLTFHFIAMSTVCSVCVCVSLS